jgi:hypothetical protein
MHRDNLSMSCRIVDVGRRRDGGTKYWCLAHRANATAKYGVAAEKCVAADDPPIKKSETLDLDFKDYPGGVALWGSVPAVYDTTKERLRIPFRADLLSDGWAEVDEIDAINFMVSGVFGFETIPVKCVHCHFAHLDRDWFAVHAHRKHQCHGCGRQFSDTEAGVGNPIAALRHMLGSKPAKQRKAPDSLSIKQRDFPGGIQIWGSNPAILWTSTEPEMTGIHVHAFEFHGQKKPTVDETYAKVTIDGVKLDPDQVRTYMGQSAMPHLEGRVVDLVCSSCGQPHFEQGDHAFTPHIDHECQACSHVFQAPSQMKKTISNPFVGIRKQLAQYATGPLREDKLGLRPESI